MNFHSRKPDPIPERPELIKSRVKTPQGFTLTMCKAPAVEEVNEDAIALAVARARNNKARQPNTRPATRFSV